MSASAPSASTTSAIVWPGRARSSADASSSTGCAAPVLPDAGGETVDDAVGGKPELLGDGTRGALVRARDDEVVDLVGVDTCILQCRLPTLRHPGSCSGSRRTAPPTPSNARRPECANDRGTPRSWCSTTTSSAMTGRVADEQCGRAVAAARFLGSAGQPAPDVGRDDERGSVALDRGPQRAQRRSHRADRSRTQRRTRPAGARRGSRSRWSCRGTRARPSRTTARRCRRWVPYAERARAASTPMVVVSSS